MPIAGAALLPAIIGGAATVGSALIGSSAANSAAQAQKDAAQKAQDTQLQMYNQSRADLEPYNTTGKGALTSLADLYGLPTAENPNGGQAMSQSALDAFSASPDYQFTKQQGITAQDYSAASKGMLLSGAQQKELADYTSGLASQQFNNYVSRLQGIATMGENAANHTGAAATATGSGIAQSQIAAGNDEAAGIKSSAGAIQAGLTGLGAIGADYASKSAYQSPLATVTPGQGLYG